jgi:hypothetical protein
MRSTALSLVFVTMFGGLAVLAQSPPAVGDSPNSEEIIVRGRRLTDLRFEVEQAQERAYAIFNELNSDDDFDVYCRDERRYHSRATTRVCRPQFENRISAEAAQEYMSALSWRCPAEMVGQECLFSDYSSAAKSAAQGAESAAPNKREQMKEEIVRLANQDEGFAQAILDWYEKTEQYEGARKRRRED